MFRSCIVVIFMCWSMMGCASTIAYRSFSEIYNDPILEVKSAEVTEDGSYRLCVTGKLKKNGFGEYHISIPEEHARNSGFRCRNNKGAAMMGKYSCIEYTIPIIHTKSEEVAWGCETFDEKTDTGYTAGICGKDHRTLIIKDSEKKDVAEVFVTEIWGETNPIVILLLPFTVAFDVVTFPLQAWCCLGMALGR